MRTKTKTTRHTSPRGEKVPKEKKVVANAKRRDHTKPPVQCEDAMIRELPTKEKAMRKKELVVWNATMLRAISRIMEREREPVQEAIIQAIGPGPYRLRDVFPVIVEVGGKSTREFCCHIENLDGVGLTDGKEESTINAAYFINASQL